jgi:hypothetical protein
LHPTSSQTPASPYTPEIPVPNPAPSAAESYPLASSSSYSVVAPFIIIIRQRFLSISTNPSLHQTPEHANFSSTYCFC